MRRLLLIVVALCLLGAVAAGSASADRYRLFQTPSRNIGCVYAPPEPSAKTPYLRKPYLRCDIGTGLKPLPLRPKSCDLDWGYGYWMRAIGRARPFCAGDTARNSRAPVLRYGRTWRHGGFTCVSRRTGLRCTNRSRHGFFLSRERSYVF